MNRQEQLAEEMRNIRIVLEKFPDLGYVARTYLIDSYDYKRKELEMLQDATK